MVCSGCMRSDGGLGFAVAVKAAVLALAATAAGCSIKADYGGTAYACDESRTCPGGQVCLAGECRESVDARRAVDGDVVDVDGSGGGGDAPIDGQPAADAAAQPGDSCLQLLEMGYTTSGLYELKPPRPPRSPIPAYCEQTIAGGGWTLVARSASGGTGNFGWSSSRGSPSDGDDPYAQNLDKLAAFTEVLVATRATTGLEAGDIVYRLAMPSGFPDSFAGSATGALAAITEGGTCAPDGGPGALLFWGFTSVATHYFFDGSATLSLNGLTPGGFLVETADCAAGGDLADGVQGMLFVR